MSVQASPDRGPAERDLPDAGERALDALRSLPHLRGVPAELLAERHRDGVHQMRAARLDDVVELGRLRLQRRRELVERRQQVVRELVERCEMDGRREDVVRRLAHVDVVVRVHVIARERGHHLVRVHVRRRARAGLEDVDRELVVELAGGDALAGLGDALCLAFVEQAELGVDSRRGRLDATEPARDGGRDRLAGDGEVGNRFARLVPPELAPFLGAGHVLSVVRGGRYEPGPLVSPPYGDGSLFAALPETFITALNASARPLPYHELWPGPPWHSWRSPLGRRVFAYGTF